MGASEKHACSRLPSIRPLSPMPSSLAHLAAERCPSSSSFQRSKAGRSGEASSTGGLTTTADTRLRAGRGGARGVAGPAPEYQP